MEIRKKSSVKEENSFNSETNIERTTKELLIFSEDFGIKSYYDKHLPINPGIQIKLRKLNLPILKENKGKFKQENYENYLYKKLELEYVSKSKFNYRKNKIIAIEHKDIMKIKEFIFNVKKKSEEKKIIYKIIINNEKNTLSVYLGINNELIKNKFKSKDSDNFLDEIIQYCHQSEILFYSKHSIKENDIKTLFCTYFFEIIKQYNIKCCPSRIIDLFMPNYISIDNGSLKDSFDINNNNIIYSYNSIYSEYLFGDYFNKDKSNNSLEKYFDEENDKKNVIVTIEVQYNAEELKILIINMIFYQENHKDKITYILISKEKEEKEQKSINHEFPDIYLEINEKLFMIIIKWPGLSLYEFNEFCEKEAYINIYKKIKFLIFNVI